MPALWATLMNTNGVAIARIWTRKDASKKPTADLTPFPVALVLDMPRIHSNGDESLAPSKLEDSFKPDLSLHHALEGGGRLVQGEGLDHGLYPLLLCEGHRVR